MSSNTDDVLRLPCGALATCLISLFTCVLCGMYGDICGIIDHGVLSVVALIIVLMVSDTERKKVKPVLYYACATMLLFMGVGFSWAALDPCPIVRYTRLASLSVCSLTFMEWYHDHCKSQFIYCHRQKRILHNPCMPTVAPRSP